MPEIDDTRDVLLMLAETLQTQLAYVTGLHRNVTALYDALLQLHPGLQNSFRAEMEKIRVFPETERLQRNIDAVLAQLRSGKL